ncbi:pyridoxamine 5'-phosphate oxidase family protein [Acetivibrio ethanolgignens]|uniref:5-nitroimidazole antibiotic resistance protein n=1 Tax=Acetivibrio ethanolgignens TaxID=290052 RepID=A0A0V8QAQ3_9FIRM|nr:pyridoxamine 5'-phosphate oxidase family protein [Acetivibrio ethanolgignens]KSV57661.1 5-nitroimidazole antibiotic resistance protein [Acetivibrio ethanolgignens]
MFRKMRRFKQQLSEEASIAVLERGTAGVLAVAGDDDYPYAVPLSYVYYNAKLYFHVAKSGHKLDAIRKNDKVSFCVIDKNQIVPEEYTTYFRSVIAFGRIKALEGEEKREALEALAAKYSPEQVEGRKAEIDRQIEHVCMLELTIEHLSGKEAIELVNFKKV